MPAIIQSIQQISITIPSGGTTATATINSVNTANAAIFWNGRTTTYNSTSIQFVSVALTLTNATTVTATRGASVANSVTVDATIVEFVSSVVNSVQYGNIAISAGTTGTYTLPTTVGTNAFVIWNGSIAAGSSTIGVVEGSVSLNQSTDVVTATVVTSGTATIYFCVVDLTSTAIASVQQVPLTGSTGGTTSFPRTITSVTTANTILVYGGLSGSSTNWSNGCYNVQLTNATTVTFTRTGGNNVTSNALVTAVQFQSGVLSTNAVQRGTTAISAGTSNTSTLTNAVNTTFALCNYCGFQTSQGSAAPTTALPTLALTNTTTVTSTLATSGTNTAAWEVIEFLAAANTTSWSTTDKTAGVTLSGSNLIATASTTGQAVRTIDRLVSGKLYWEYTFTSFTGTLAVGIATQAPTLPVSVTGGSDYVIVNTAGTFFVNGAGVVNFGALSAGNVVCFALDLTAQLIWARIGAAGNWNNNASANPATPLGGISIANWVGDGVLPAYGLAVFNVSASSSITANFGASAFAGSVPAGFTSGFLSGITPTLYALETQIAVEEFARAATVAAQLTQIGVEEWARAAAPAVQLTQIAIEEWASVAVAVAGAPQARVMVLA